MCLPIVTPPCALPVVLPRCGSPLWLCCGCTPGFGAEVLEPKLTCPGAPCSLRGRAVRVQLIQFVTFSNQNRPQTNQVGYVSSMDDFLVLSGWSSKWKPCGSFLCRESQLPSHQMGGTLSKTKKVDFLIGRPIENDAFEMVNVLDLLKWNFMSTFFWILRWYLQDIN